MGRLATRSVFIAEPAHHILDIDPPLVALDLVKNAEHIPRPELEYLYGFRFFMLRYGIVFSVMTLSMALRTKRKLF